MNNYLFARIMDGGQVMATLVRPLFPNFKVQLTSSSNGFVVLSSVAMLKAVQVCMLASDFDVGNIISLSEEDSQVLEICRSSIDGSLAFLIRREDNKNQDSNDGIEISKMALLLLGNSLMPVLTGQEQPETLDIFLYEEGEHCDCHTF